MATEQFPALAGGVRGVLVHPDALARLRAGAFRRGARRIRTSATPVRPALVGTGSGVARTASAGSGRRRAGAAGVGGGGWGAVRGTGDRRLWLWRVRARRRAAPRRVRPLQRGAARVRGGVAVARAHRPTRVAGAGGRADGDRHPDGRAGVRTAAWARRLGSDAGRRAPGWRAPAL